MHPPATPRRPPAPVLVVALHGAVYSVAGWFDGGLRQRVWEWAWPWGSRWPISCLGSLATPDPRGPHPLTYILISWSLPTAAPTPRSPLPFLRAPSSLPPSLPVLSLSLTLARLLSLVPESPLSSVSISLSERRPHPRRPYKGIGKLESDQRARKFRK